MRFSGVTLAELALTVAPGAGVTDSRLAVEGKGLVTLLGPSFTRMAARSRTAGGDPAPQRFEAQQQKPDRYREALVRWAADGAVAEASEVKNGRKRPSEVPDGELAGTVDPLTALLRLRDWIAAPSTVAEATTRERVFDGRKRFDLEARRLPDGEDGAGRPVHRIAARVLPVYGLDERDSYVSWPDRPARWFEVLIAADGSYAPLAVRENGAAIIELTRDCMREPGCQPPAPPG